MNRVRIDRGVLSGGGISEASARNLFHYDKAGRRDQDRSQYGRTYDSVAAADGFAAR